MSHKLMSLLALVFVFASAPVVSAQGIWSSAGVTAAIDEEDTSIYRFNDTGSISIKSSVARGTLNVRFPVQTLRDLIVPQEGDCPQLRVNLRDTGPGARVIVRLMALSIFPGADGAPRPLTSLGEIDSDTRPPMGDPTQYRSYVACIPNVPPDSEFLTDYAFFAYYVDVQLIKTTSTANPGLMSVQICSAADACDP